MAGSGGGGLLSADKDFSVITSFAMLGALHQLEVSVFFLAVHQLNCPYQSDRGDVGDINIGLR